MNQPNINMNNVLKKLEEQEEVIKRMKKMKERMMECIRAMKKEQERVANTRETIKAVEIDPKHLKITNGELGGVFEADCLVSRKVAVKEIAFENIGYCEDYLRDELKFRISLFHPNVIRTYGYSKPNRNGLCVQIIMEKMEMNLHDFVHKRVLTLEKKLRIMKEMTKGLDYLHTQKPVILHHNIKGSNYLVSEDGERVKIYDFGLVKLVRNVEEEVYEDAGRGKGTLQYYAPETLMSCGGIYSIKSDVYSLGVAFWEILFEKLPFVENEENIISPDQLIIKGKRPSLEVEEQQIPRELKKLLEWCWKEDRRERPTTGDLLDWFDERELDMMCDYENMFIPNKRTQLENSKKKI